MKLKMKRIVLFTRNMEAMTVFYRDALGLKQVTDEKGWREFDAGGVTIGLHSGPPTPKAKGPKIAFYAADVAAARAELVARGVKLGKVGAAPYFLCDFRDPDGNAVQLSSR